MTEGEKFILAVVGATALVLLEPDLMRVADNGAKLFSNSLRNSNLAGLLGGGLITVAAMTAAFEKHPKLLAPFIQ